MNEKDLQVFIDHEVFLKRMDAIRSYREEGMSLEDAKRRAEEEIKEPEGNDWTDWSMTSKERGHAVQAVKELIRRAFEGVELGNGVSLHQAEALDDYQPESAVAAARCLDEEKSWQDIDDTKIARFSSALSFVDSEGFRFYVPRFITWALDNPNSESFSLDAAIYSCYSHGDLQDYTGEILAPG